MNVHELLADRQVGLPTAHPDDHLPHTQTLYIATRLATVHEITYTKGRNSTLNYRQNESPPFDVKAGDREAENLIAATILGIKSQETHDATDGGLASEINELVPTTIAWILRHDINLLLTTGGLDDHPDHLAAGEIAMQAACQLHQKGYDVDILALQFSSQPGSIQVEATPEAMELAFRTAAAHGSQFLLSHTIEGSWPIVPGGMSMHPDSFAGIRRYPVLRDAHYVYHPAGSIITI